MNLRVNILATLAYYDVFDFPLKAKEVQAKMVKFDHLGNHQLPTANNQLVVFESIKKELDQLLLDGIISMREGLYFLGGLAPLEAGRPKVPVAPLSVGRLLMGREHIVPLRQKREKIVKRKWQIARRAIWWLRLVPYIRAVFASGSLAMRNTDELSDLDVLIVAKHGRIWLTRFWISAVLTVLGVRRKAGDKIAPDKVCLNHYITDKSLHIPHQSIYTAQTYANLVPIYLRNTELIEEFEEANQWVLNYVLQWNISFLEANPQQPMFGG